MIWLLHLSIRVHSLPMDTHLALNRLPRCFLVAYAFTAKKKYASASIARSLP